MPRLPRQGNCIKICLISWRFSKITGIYSRGGAERAENCHRINLCAATKVPFAETFFSSPRSPRSPRLRVRLFFNAIALAPETNALRFACYPPNFNHTKSVSSRGGAEGAENRNGTNSSAAMEGLLDRQKGVACCGFSPRSPRLRVKSFLMRLPCRGFRFGLA